MANPNASGTAYSTIATTIAVTFLHDGLTEIANGFPVKIVLPCEGTGYEVGSMSVIKARGISTTRKNSTIGR
jgi:iron(III) transport system substrate-binding protein